jgi:hypothetical protein
LATNDHISSNWISRVSGGKSHEFVVSVLGVLAGQTRQSHDRVAMHADESFGLADSGAFAQVFQDRDRLLVRQTRAEQRGALTFRESSLACLAVKESDVLVLPGPVADREVASVASTVERTGCIPAAEAREVVHGCESSWAVANRRIIGRKSQDKLRLDSVQ